MMTTAGVVTMGGVATTVAGTVAGDILAGVITMGGGILAGGTVGGTTNPRVLTFARVCQRSDVSLVPYSLASCLGVARRPPQGAPPGPPPPSPWHLAGTEVQRESPEMAHRVISLRCGIWSLSG